MRKTIMFIIFMFTILTTAVFAAQNWTAYEVGFKIFLNNVQKNFKNPIVAINDNTYIPLREVSEQLGINVDWDAQTSSVYLITPTDESDEEKYIYPFEENGLWGYKDEDGKIVVEAKYVDAFEFSDGLGRVRKEKGFNGKYGFIDKNGNEVIPCQYQGAYDFIDGVTVVSLATRSDEDNDIYIDKSGDRLFDKQFKGSHLFHDGYAAVIKTERDIGVKEEWSYINKKGEFATKMTFDEAGDFENGYAYVVKDGVEGRIDTEFNFYPEE